MKYTVFIQQTRSIVVNDADSLQDAVYEAHRMFDDAPLKVYGDKQTLFVEEFDDEGNLVQTHEQF